MTVGRSAAIGIDHPGAPSAMRPAGLALAVGAVGVVITSICYGLSPPDAAMPVAPLSLEAAIEGSVRGQGTMYAAGLAGVPADLLISAAGILIGVLEAARGRGMAAMGWFLIAVSTVLFAIVDTLVGFVLPPLATAGGQGFLAAKMLFNALFLAGTAAFGAGAVLALLPHILGTGEVSRVLAAPALIFALIALASGLAGLMGASVHPNVLGLGVAGGAFLFALIGLSLARGQAPAG